MISRTDTTTATREHAAIGRDRMIFERLAAMFRGIAALTKKLMGALGRFFEPAPEQGTFCLYNPAQCSSIM